MLKVIILLAILYLKKYKDKESSREPEEKPTPARDNGAWERAPAQVQRALTKHFPNKAVRKMAMIAECESSFRSSAHCSGCLGVREDSRGILQVNVIAHPQFAAWNLYNPDVCARAARIIWDSQGYRAWLNCSRKLGIAI